MSAVAAIGRRIGVRRRATRSMWFAAGLFVIMLASNFAVRPSFLDPPNYLAPTLAGFAPLALAAFASTPSILTGGIDISVGPLLGLVNVLIVVTLMPHGLDSPWTLVPIVLAVGAAVGLVNGLLASVVRLPPIVATLGTYLVLSGLNVRLLPTPEGPAPGWMGQLGNNVGPVPGAVILVGAAALVWAGVVRTPYHKALLAVGGDEAVAYSSGIDTVTVKIVAYTLGGVFAALAGLALTALIGSADATVGPTYTLDAIAAVALGGTSMAGGSGGLTASFLGAAVIFLISNLLALLNASIAWLQIAYGAILVASLLASYLLRQRVGTEGRR